MSYRTNLLGDAAYLASLGHEIQATHPHGEIIIFEFALEVSQAERLLEAPERQICARYQRALRIVRKRIDMTLYGAKVQ